MRRSSASPSSGLTRSINGSFRNVVSASLKSHYINYWLTDGGQEKLAEALSAPSPVTLTVYYDDVQITKQSLYYEDTPASAPNLITVGLTAESEDTNDYRYGSGNGRSVPLQMNYTIPNPFPFDISLSGLNLADMTRYLERDEIVDADAKGNLTRRE